MKPLIWHDSIHEDVKGFAPVARQNIGNQLHRAQNGSEPSDWKPMPGIGKGVKEIRIHAETEYRAIYIAHFEEAISVRHAIVKKTPKTGKNDIDLASRRFAILLNSREGR